MHVWFAWLAAGLFGRKASERKKEETIQLVNQTCGSAADAALQ